MGGLVARRQDNDPAEGDLILAGSSYYSSSAIEPIVA